MPRAHPLAAAAAAALLLAALAAAAEMPREGEWLTDPDRFPGWRGSLPAAARGPRVDATAAAAATGGPEELWSGRVEQLSWSPRAYLFHSFLSDAEADHLVALGEHSLTKSSVVDSDTGGSIDSEVRTSDGTFLDRRQDAVVAAIERRIALVSLVPESHQESLQILR